MTVRQVDQVAREVVEAGTATTRQVLISPDEAPNFAMRKFTIGPGGSMPPHTNTVEHEQYVLGGRAQVGIGDDVIQVKKDDVVYIPAGVPHWYRTEGDESFEFICVVPNKPDKIELVQSG
ncbi:MAG: cupin domain-containing protein [Gemmatimonadales bacterium]